MRPLAAIDCLPDDLDQALLVGRAWQETPRPGPVLLLVRDGQAIDVTHLGPTMADLLEHPDLADTLRAAEGPSLGPVEVLIENALDAPQRAPHLLAPCDVQAVKACGVTFAVSLLERVIEEQAGGDPASATRLRDELQALIGGDLSRIVPGSDEAMSLKRELQDRGGWSQYMEVGIGPDAEVFTKAQPLSSVGFGASVGLHPASQWNNPEPEIVLAVDSRGSVKGATLGNDVNLRDIEGRSALLLGKAKDNNASSAIGPFIRLFDDAFGIDAVRHAHVTLRIEGEDDGFLLEGDSDMAEISRDPLDLVRQTLGAHHQYPDGVMLYLGTMFSPIQDRDGAGQGFTHHLGDRVTIATPRLGALVNRVGRSDQLAPWTYGIRALMRDLAAR
ncbi:MAG: fumarylacetoacetate hydrolase family protein [Halomonas sp.]